MVVDMLNNPDQGKESDEYLTPAKASQMVFLSRRQLSRYADEGKIRAIRPGVHRRYLRADIEALAATSQGSDAGSKRELSA